jgi:hypothetical protein
LDFSDAVSMRLKRNFDAASVRDFDAASVRDFDAASVRDFNAASVRDFDAASVRDFNATSMRFRFAEYARHQPPILFQILLICGG